MVGLERLVDLDLMTNVRKALLSRNSRQDGVSANSILIAGVISVFSQPLGIGQGQYPTCQAARGISLWAQHAPGYLLGLLISAARDGFVEIPFEGETLKSDELPSITSLEVGIEVDPVSQILVPHLDRIYAEMMKRAALRNQDGHKWVNPALYGSWVQTGLETIFADPAKAVVSGYEGFVRRFFATHHPAYNDGHALMYPNPVGICITNNHGDYLGPHAVSIQRIANDPEGDLRGTSSIPTTKAGRIGDKTSNLLFGARERKKGNPHYPSINLSVGCMRSTLTRTKKEMLMQSRKVR